MARQKLRPKSFFVAVTALVAFVVLSGAAVFFAMAGSRSIAKLRPFPAQSYMDGKNLWSREDYALKGKVENVLLRSEDSKRYLISVRPEGSDLVIPVFLAAKNPDDPTVEREQELCFKVHVGQGGEILCNAYE